jgi:hypothetical protein
VIGPGHADVAAPGEQNRVPVIAPLRGVVADLRQGART